MGNTGTQSGGLLIAVFMGSVLLRMLHPGCLSRGPVSPLPRLQQNLPHIWAVKGPGGFPWSDCPRLQDAVCSGMPPFGVHPSAKPLAFLTQVNLNVTSVLPAGTLELARVVCVWARACHVCSCKGARRARFPNTCCLDLSAEKGRTPPPSLSWIYLYGF